MSDIDKCSEYKPDELTEDCDYLIRDNYRTGNLVYKINVVTVTKTSYELKYQNQTDTTWQMKKDFHYKYSVIEDISNKPIDQKLLDLEPLTKPRIL